MQLKRSYRGARGFTLVELMVTLAVAAVLAAVAMPVFRTWIANAKVRAATESVASQIRLAQAEAVKRYRRVVVYRASASGCGTSTTAPAYDASGSAWIIKTIPLYAGDAEEVVQCGSMADTTTDVDITPAAACFGTNGWPITLASTATGAGVACTVSAAGTVTFAVSKVSVSDRPLQVTVGLSGAVRMCDPAKTFSATNPDGCPSS